MTWFAIEVAPRRERAAGWSLHEHGFDAYCPMETVWRRTKRSKFKADQPIFPRYIFVYVPLNRSLYEVANIEHVTGIVGIGGVARPIREQAWVEEMRGQETLGAFDKTISKKLTFRPGQPVRVIGGPFSGFLADVLSAKDGDARVRVLLKGFGGGAATLDVAKLEAAWRTPLRSVRMVASSRTDDRLSGNAPEKDMPQRGGPIQVTRSPPHPYCARSTRTAPVQKLIDLPGVAAVEKAIKAVDPWNTPKPGEYGSDDLYVELFGLTHEMAEHLADTSDEYGVDDDGVYHADPAGFYDDERWEQLYAIEDLAQDVDRIPLFRLLGWDVTDGDSKPLRCLPCFSLPLTLAALGLAGKLAEPIEGKAAADDWGASLEAEARRFRTQR